MSADFDNKGAHVGTLNQAGESIYIGSTHVEGNGPVTINNIRLERHWTRPVPPAPMRDTIPREQAFKEVSMLLLERGQLALSGKIAATAVRGMAGIGKTTLAQQLALKFEHERNPRYPDGILWEHIGPDVLSADKVQLVLDRWAGHALAIPTDSRTRVHFEPGAVRALLSEHPRLLVVLDNVWSLEAIRPLREALPAQAHLLITTRSGSVAHELGGARYELHELTPEEARRLMAMRLSLEDITPHVGWFDELAVGLGFHALALDIALARLQYEGNTSADWRASSERIVEYVHAGKGFEDLHIEEGESERNVELVLSYSYQHMAELAQRCFRLLGTFAPDADFDTGAVARLWRCGLKQAKRQLDDFVNAALLGRMQGRRWQQHSLLRGYALALLRRQGEHKAAAASHARIYGEAMKQADNAQCFASMRPELPQLRHAFEWAVENDLEQAVDLIGNCANLQVAFGLASESLDWSRAALTTARQRGNSVSVAHVQVLLGNALQRVASLPNQDRGARLREALAAYSEALRCYTPESAPLDYATTQNNRANLLGDLADLPEEDRGARLREALVANEEALRFRTSQAAPLDYAMTQNNRAILLGDLASLPEEDRGARLREALVAYEEALRHYTPESAPLDYATTQNNRANLLSDLADLPGEDRGACLREALVAYGEALRFRTPQAAPLDYAMTQNNRANLLSDLASLPGEDRGARLREALVAYGEALRFRTPQAVPLAYATTQNNRAILLGDLADLPEEDRGARLHEALVAYGEALRFRTPQAAPLDYAMTQNNRANLLSDLASLPGEDRGARLREALRMAWTALMIFRNFQHQQYQEYAVSNLQKLRFVCGSEFDALWEELNVGPLPQWLTEQGWPWR